MSSSGEGGAGEESFKCFVGGLAWSMDDQVLGDSFRRFGTVLDAKVMLQKDGKSRGFGFVTFADQKALDNAIEGLHNKELEGRVVTVNKAVPPGKERHKREWEREHEDARERESFHRDYAIGYSAREDIRGDTTRCFRCGGQGHWARECRARPEREHFGSYGRYGERVPPPPPPPRPVHDFYQRYERYDDEYGRERRYEYPRLVRASERVISGGPLRYESYRGRPGPYDRYDRFRVAVTYDRPRGRGARSAYDRY